MRKMTVCLTVTMGTLLFTQFTVASPPLRLDYDEPATDWMTEALPIGNGYMGAMFFGGHDEEHIQFNDGTLWAGGPGAHPDYNYGNREGAAAHLEPVRALIRANKTAEANELASKELTGIIHKQEGETFEFGDYGAQQTMGDLYVTVDNKAPITDYSRRLDIGNGLGHVRYKAGDIHHTRTHFGSYPNRTMVYHFENDHPTGTTYVIRIETPHPVDTLEFLGNVVHLKGHVEDNALSFETRVKIQTDGNIEALEGNRFQVSGAQSLTLYHFAHTAYRNEYPTYRGTDYIAKNDAVQQALIDMDFHTVKTDHVIDHQNLFGRFSLRLGSAPESKVYTDARLKAYKEGAEDLALEVLHLQYARYMTIAASRPGSLPMHLQGKWNNSTNPPWAADYHTNINLQMAYWPAEVTNLSECHQPLLDYTASLVAPGQVTAKTHFGTRGWTVNTMNNAYGFTAPGWAFPWGFFPGGAGWLAQHHWEHYAFTLDEDFLRNEAYPVMKEAALFWIDYLQKNEAGDLVSIPSYSPEHGGISAGASMDHQIAWDLLDNCVEAAVILEIEDEFSQAALRVRDQISKPTVGRWGQLQEWIEDLDDPESHHRHLSHLFALFPGDQINLRQTPEWAQAAKVSLDARGEGGPTWSLAWKACFWARLGEGDRAYKNIRRALRFTTATKIGDFSGTGVYQNLFSAYPHFQLDGNMGAAAAIVEMLIQSHGGEIHLLPALPSNWPEGEVKGLVARGGHEVDIAWKDGVLTSATIRNPKGAVVRYGDKTIKLPSAQADVVLSIDSFDAPQADAS